MSAGSSTQELRSAIRHLAAWADRLRGGNDTAHNGVDALKPLIEAARRHASQALADYQATVQRSAETLEPIGDPLSTLDFTAHRWMAGHREEAYSDWLQWIISQIGALEVLRVFGVDDPRMVSTCEGCAVRIERERRVLEGHAGSSGRLDLEIRFGDSALLVVEVKLGDADDADTAKGAGYHRSVEQEHGSWRITRYVILALDAGDQEYFGFKPRLWEDVCIELRVVAAQSCRCGQYLKAAMTLAFVSAVEQNLLGLRSIAQAHIDDVTTALSISRTTEHLVRFLEAFDHGERHYRS